MLSFQNLSTLPSVITITVAIILFNTGSAWSIDKINQAIELGSVDWGENFEQALERSKTEGKPVLALFQEVPGCAGCKQFGRDVLSQSLLVEAIEREFIPTVIYNNRSGKDAVLLKRFNEPAWNYQVVRFFDHQAQDIIPRKDRVWDVGNLARRMSVALERSGREVPLYLKGLALEHDNPNLREAFFAMYCYWTGEMELGAIDGVISTEAGHYAGREVTRVWYDEKTISLPSLVAEAQKVECAKKVFLKAQEIRAIEQETKNRLELEIFNPHDYHKASASDQKKQIEGSRYLQIGLSPFQLTKVNAFARRDKARAHQYLSLYQKTKLGL